MGVASEAGDGVLLRPAEEAAGRPQLQRRARATVEEDARWRELLAIPDDLAIVTGVTIGLPAEDPEWDRTTSVFSQRLLAHDEVIQWNRWSS